LRHQRHDASETISIMGRERLIAAEHRDRAPLPDVVDEHRTQLVQLSVGADHLSPARR